MGLVGTLNLAKGNYAHFYHVGPLFTRLDWTHVRSECREVLHSGEPSRYIHDDAAEDEYQIKQETPPRAASNAY